MTKAEIPEEAVAAVAAVLNDWFDVPVSAPAVSREALEAALPHLRVQETPVALSDEAIEAARQAAIARWQTGSADTTQMLLCVADALAAANTHPTPHLRPVVDRGALRDEIAAAILESDIVSKRYLDPADGVYESRADAALALLPTEEGGHSVEETKRLTKFCHKLGKAEGRREAAAELEALYRGWADQVGEPITREALFDAAVAANELAASTRIFPEGVGHDQQVRNGLTQKQRKSRNRRIAYAIDIYAIRMSPPMGRNWKKDPYGTREGESL